MRRLIPYLKAYRLKIIAAILLIVLAAGLIALSPTLEGMITTQLLHDVTAGNGVNFPKLTGI
ncbi:MAG: ABC transporter ATP-binding protein, partial [Clostridium sp.]